MPNAAKAWPVVSSSGLTLHVFILGYLIYAPSYIPRVLSVLFLAAAVGYLIDNVGILW